MMKQNAGKRIDNILIKLPESMRDRIRKLRRRHCNSWRRSDPDEHGHAADQRWQRV